MSEIQLLIDGDDDRNALATLLEPQFQVVTDASVQTVDCHLVDDRTLPSYEAQLRTYKESAHPTFCPVILLRRPEIRIDIDAADGPGPSLVDDIVNAPVDREILSRRMENLLVRREQSITLTRRYEEVEARFEGLFNGMPNPSFVLDESEEVTECNTAFCELLGVERQTVVGQTLDALSGAEFDATVPDDSVWESETDSDERIVRFKDESGADRYGVLTSQTETVGDDRRTVCVLSDITDLKEKTERLEQFASVLSHDLRNPLQVALMRTRVLHEEFPEARDHLDSIELSLTRMQDIIQKLLTVARTGPERIDHEQVSLRSVVHNAWQTVDTPAADLTVDIGPDHVVEGDEERLLQLFENLFRNAVEHGSTSDTNVEVRVGPLEDGFYVEDDGPGIPVDKREAVFRMGFSTAEEGNGLGLGIVMEIADAHGWTPAVLTSPNGGARFEFQ